jgi:hypothetical protein
MRKRRIYDLLLFDTISLFNLMSERQNGQHPLNGDIIRAIMG